MQQQINPRDGGLHGLLAEQIKTMTLEDLDIIWRETFSDQDDREFLEQLRDVPMQHQGRSVGMYNGLKVVYTRLDDGAHNFCFFMKATQPWFTCKDASDLVAWRRAYLISFLMFV